LEVKSSNSIMKLYTIGYSSFSIEQFIDTLKQYNITALADVRSQPYSRYRPDFNRESLNSTLKTHNIAYVFLGDLCGGRIDAPDCYVEGRADYTLIAKHPKFQKGLGRIRQGTEKYQIALMCAEKDPIMCHRAILICKNLVSENIRIVHILEGGGLESHEETERRLIRLSQLDQPSLFKPSNNSLEKAYRMQAEKIAYKPFDSS